MRFLAGLMVVVGLMTLPVASFAEQDRVVTIYFCGTSLDQTMWEASQSPFENPETVALLHGKQVVSPVINQHKFIVDGIGSGGFLGLNIIWGASPTVSDGLAILSGRGWVAVQDEAYAFLDDLVETYPDDNDANIILNLVGFSRGATTVIMFAHNLIELAKYSEVAARIKHINLLAFDPVPGDQLAAANQYKLPAKVKHYIGFYARDERSIAFAPVFPAVTDTSGTEVYEAFMVPGSHETMVGNTYKDGHRNLWLGGKQESLTWVSKYVKIIATELLGSADWGHVWFAPSLDWYDGGTIASLSEKVHTEMANIYASPKPSSFYEYMRDYSFILFLLESWETDGAGYCNDFLVNVDNSRCATLIYPGWDFPVLTPDPNMSIDFAIPLNQYNGANLYVWDLLERDGHLDPDYDNIDLKDDNCPDVDNVSQTNFDGDDFGDACDDDVDGDGVLNSDDQCWFTPLGDVADPENGCSIGQLVPCYGPDGGDYPWRNKGSYVSILTKVVKDFFKKGLISPAEKGAIISTGARSVCGVNP